VSPAVQPVEPSALTSVAASYAAQLVAIANANVRIALEFSQRLARIRSPLEFFAVGAEFSRRRIQMLREQSASLLPKSG
jgi:hypothetical protein